ncbi:MAG: homocysteine S-methyltransferase family protein [Candidatus Rokubacteria bacterium]|nr:homocysteine S-methyltransferase family protein [Candidatus Rokubacteria bacterium]
MTVIDAIQRLLTAGERVILDGATGTELERRGARMHEAVWCAMATLSHGDPLREIHADYIFAGADVITTNTFAASRTILGPAGLGERVPTVIRRAVAIAKEAIERAAAGRPIAIAGSMSHMVPLTKGADTRDPKRLPTPSEVGANAREMAHLLAEAGVDLLLMEMMSDPDLTLPTIEAARTTGLPVWVGISCRRAADRRLVAYSRPELALERAIDAIVGVGGDVFGIMHSPVDATTEALGLLRARWSGPLMAYPESGYFEMPNWRFVDVIAPEAFAEQARVWAASGVQILGGCCGLRVEHIRALTGALHHASH